MMSLTERVATAALALLIAMPPAAAAPQRAQAVAPRVQSIPIDVQCPTSPVPGTGQSFKGQSLVNRSFAYLDLRNADFSGATLDGVVFIGANLTGANFSGASFVNVNVPALPVDFMRADLTSACFIGAAFQATSPPTYFTRANLTGTDFSSTNLANAVFGPLPLTFNGAIARPAFHGTTMSCEFVAAWTTLDLSGAIGIKTCRAQWKGFDFSGAVLVNVDLSGLDLTGTTWTGADIRGTNFQGATLLSTTLQPITGMGGSGVVARMSGAQFNKALITGVDFSNAPLYGANFTSANILNSSFQGAALTNDPNQSGSTAATFTGARLKNVNMSSADLTGANFNYASLFGHYGGSTPPGACSLETKVCGNPTGYTCDCASLKGAKLIGTDFSNAFLYGVDFSTSATQIKGSNFASAVLISAYFSGATVGPDPKTGKNVRFDNALLQAVDLTNTNLSGANLANAFVDFGARTNSTNGNTVFVLLPENFTTFAGWWRPGGKPSPVCVKTEYDHFTKGPTSTLGVTCPDGGSYADGCGSSASGLPTPNPRWRSPLTLATNSPVAGGYTNDASYELANPAWAGSCNGIARDFKW